MALFVISFRDTVSWNLPWLKRIAGADIERESIELNIFRPQFLPQKGGISNPWKSLPQIMQIVGLLVHWKLILYCFLIKPALAEVWMLLKLPM